MSGESPEDGLILTDEAWHDYLTDFGDGLGDQHEREILWADRQALRADLAAAIERAENATALWHQAEQDFDAVVEERDRLREALDNLTVGVRDRFPENPLLRAASAALALTCPNPDCGQVWS